MRDGVNLQRNMQHRFSSQGWPESSQLRIRSSDCWTRSSRPARDLGPENTGRKTLADAHVEEKYARKGPERVEIRKNNNNENTEQETSRGTAEY